MSDLLMVSGLAKSFGRKNVLKDVSFVLEPGRIYSLLGRNGEGKTTLARILMGVIPADRGGILFKGAHITFASAAYKREIGYIPEDPFFYIPVSALGFLIVFALSIIFSGGRSALDYILWFSLIFFLPIIGIALGAGEKILVFDFTNSRVWSFDPAKEYWKKLF